MKLLFFYSKDCRHCTGARAELVRLKGLGLEITEIDINSDPDVLVEYAIIGVPAYVLMNRDRRLCTFTGFRDSQALTESIKDVMSSLSAAN